MFSYAPPPGKLPFPAEVVIPLSILIGIVGVLIAIPLNGVIVRYRAQYTPRRIQLNPLGSAPADQRDVVGFFSIFSRVKKIEGWGGFYKGTMPMFLAIFVATPAADPRMPQSVVYRYIITLPFALALLVLQNRAVTTSRRLPWFAPHKAYHTLFTSTERDKPLLIPFGPRFALLKLVLLQGVVVIAWQFAAVFIPHSDFPELSKPVRAVLAVVFVVLYTAIFAPFEVLMVRLSIQRKGSDSLTGDVAPLYSLVGDTPVNLRGNGDAYTGVRDCWKKILKDEGWASLYRGWWLVLLSALTLVGALTAIAEIPKLLY